MKRPAYQGRQLGDEDEMFMFMWTEFSHRDRCQSKQGKNASQSCKFPGNDECAASTFEEAAGRCFSFLRIYST